MSARCRPVDPTPDEIEERAAEVRREWSPRQLRTRAGLPPEVQVEIPLVSLPRDWAEAYED